MNWGLPVDWRTLSETVSPLSTPASQLTQFMRWAAVKFLVLPSIGQCLTEKDVFWTWRGCVTKSRCHSFINRFLLCVHLDGEGVQRSPVVQALSWSETATVNESVWGFSYKNISSADIIVDTLLLSVSLYK